MKKIIFIGGGTYSIELLSWINHSSLAKEINVIGFYDDSKKAPLEKQGINYLGQIKECTSFEGHKLLISIATPKIRDRFYQELSAKGASFYKLVHPNSFVSENSEIGDGTIVGPFSYVGPLTNIENNCILNVNVSIGHHCKIDVSSVIFSQVDVCGGVSIGKRVLIGSNSTVLPNKKLGENVRVAASSCVSVNVGDNKIFSGTILQKKIF